MNNLIRNKIVFLFPIFIIFFIFLVAYDSFNKKFDEAIHSLFLNLNWIKDSEFEKNKQDIKIEIK